ncbi:carbohydrate ABC transporter permease [Blastococcus sp. PRF04-17]|uniref:carbohydrate ABC transporter permease n=1 Tax=Blastococcus sp. PRF04-17 TaxID=2933797 RepID=UPI001FF669F5|nr:sugar ABC transporter permease [Blastococcus sp. PRF04-17]UOY03156.1 sugar ABC transporter permease [Blastococcus sp. PRF04-17]
MATTVTAPRSDTVSDDRRGGAPRRGDPHRAGAAPWLFLAPYLVLFVAFVLGPIVYGLYISLHRYDFTLPNKPFVGLENYTDLFTPGSVTFDVFWRAMRATAIFTVMSVPLLLVVPLVIALVMNKKFPGRNVFRALYFAPYVLGVAVVAILWRYLLDANIGPVNYYLGLLGLPDDTNWTTSTPAAWFALVGVTVWWTLGFNAVIYLAGLQDIPKELYEAAEMDGANRWQQFRNVTLPGLKPVLSFVTMITIIASANMFGQSYLITRGAPGTETRTAIYQIAETGLRNYQMGSAAAMSYVLTVFLIILSLGVFWLFREKQARKKEPPLQAAPMALRQGRG